MITYNWIIHSLTKRTLNNYQDVIISVVWEKIGTDHHGHVGSCKSSINFDLNNINLDLLIPYGNLKKEDLIRWVLSIVDEQYINNSILNEIENSRLNLMQVNVGDFPWENKKTNNISTGT
jgi:hypothetical protein